MNKNTSTGNHKIIQEDKKNCELCEKNKVNGLDILLKTISTIISGIVIAIVGLYIWKEQNMTSQNQKLYENKIEVFKKLSMDGTKMIHYSEFMIRTKLELYQLIENEYDSTFRPSQDLRIYEKTMKNQLIVQKDKPILYAQYMKGLEFQSEFMATLIMTKTVFEPYAEIDSLQILFTEEAIVEKLKELNNDALPKISLANKESVVQSIRNEQMRLLSKILESLFSQIKYADREINKS